jgi:hypothetical protein
MDFVRTITNSSLLVNFIDLPAKLKNRQVEILILPVEEEIKPQRIPAKVRKSRGALKKYANPALVKLEKSAWKKAVGANHESR